MDALSLEFYLAQQQSNNKDNFQEDKVDEIKLNNKQSKGVGCVSMLDDD